MGFEPFLETINMRLLVLFVTGEFVPNFRWSRRLLHRTFCLPFLRHWAVEPPHLPQEFVVTAQQLKEELQEAGWVDQILVPQENQGLAKRLHRENHHKEKHIRHQQPVMYQQLYEHTSVSGGGGQFQPLAGGRCSFWTLLTDVIYCGTFTF